MESMRGVGYDAKTAIADLIDNSIAAAASCAWITFLWDGTNSSVSILDNGDGMDPEAIDRAMTLGAQPTTPRTSGDLGRFGLGLKTASLSQCRRVIVGSKCVDGPLLVRVWDLGIVESTNEWLVETQLTDAVEEAQLEPLRSLDSGTVVVWRSLDRMIGEHQVDDQQAMLDFQRTAREVEDHLGMVFHRYLEGPQPRLKLLIHGKSDEYRIKGWDPFYRSHPATQNLPEVRRGTKDGTVTIRGFVLPHKDRIPSRDFDSLGGPEGWVAQQGFYVYRNDRMLVAGTWLGLGSPKRWSRDEQHKLARLQLDLPNTLDATWSLDIKKSKAHPPLDLRDWLTRYASSVRDAAREVLVHRGRRASTTEAASYAALWHADSGPSPRYKINRGHPLVAECLQGRVTGRVQLEGLIALLEATVPIHRIWLDVSAKPEVPDTVRVQLSELLVLELAKDLLARLVAGGAVTYNAALTTIRQTEPFDQFPAVLATLEK